MGTFSITSFGHWGLRVSAFRPGTVPGSRHSAGRRALGQPGSGRVSHKSPGLQHESGAPPFTLLSLLAWPQTSYCWELTAAHQAVRAGPVLFQKGQGCGRGGTAREKGWEEEKGGVGAKGEWGGSKTIAHKGKELWGRSETVHTLLPIFALILFPSKLVPLKQPVLEGVASEVALTAYLQDRARVSLWGCLGAGGATTPSMF